MDKFRPCLGQAGIELYTLFRRALPCPAIREYPAPLPPPPFKGSLAALTRCLIGKKKGTSLNIPDLTKFLSLVTVKFILRKPRKAQQSFRSWSDSFPIPLIHRSSVPYFYFPVVHKIPSDFRAEKGNLPVKYSAPLKLRSTINEKIDQ